MQRKWIPVVVLLMVHGGLLWHSIQNQSATVDELGHLTAGLYALENHDFRCNRLSPPLQNLVCALPVYLFGDYKLTYDHTCWKQGIWNGLGERFIEANPKTFHHNLMIGRTGSMLLSLLVCGFIFFWAYRLWGYAPALGVLFLAVLEPNLIAHGRLATTDTAPVLFFLLSGYFTWLFVKQPCGKTILPVGVAFGLTWLSKHSAPVLIPAIFLVLGIVFQRIAQPLQSPWFPGLQRFPIMRPWELAAAWTLGVILIGLVTIWAGYGFEIGDSIEGPRAPKHSRVWNATQIPIQTGLYFLGLDKWYTLDPANEKDPFWLLLRKGLPAFSHWEGFLANHTNATRGNRTYFLGETTSRKLWLYYPILFFTKTPLPTLLLVGIGLLLLASHQVSVDRLAGLVGLVFPVVYLLILVYFNRAYIGYRHAMPVIPYILIFGGGASFAYFKTRCESILSFKNVWKRFSLRHVLVIFLITWVAIDVLSAHPRYLTYYNTLAGGPQNGHLVAVDSNYDWGQGLIELRDFLKKQQLHDAYLIYFGPKTHPDAYQVPHRKYTSQPTLQPGTYIISVTMLRQYIASYYLPELLSLTARSPDRIIANTLFLYEVTD